MRLPLDPRPPGLLDAEFTLDTIADLDAVRARRAAAAEACWQRFSVRASIPYGPGTGETLHLFPAKDATGPSPVLIFIHGGFWRSMAAREFAFLAPGFVPFGAALALIDYPLIPDVRLGDIVASCRRAVTWAFRDGPVHGINPNRIFVAGNSAGGHLVAEVMDGAWMREAGMPRDAIKGGTAISGLFDLSSVAASFQNEVLGLSIDEVRTFSPLLRPADVAAPLIVAVGGRETHEFLDQSERYAAHVRKPGVPVEHLVVPGMDHITVVFDALADPKAALNRAVRREMGVVEPYPV